MLDRTKALVPVKLPHFTSPFVEPKGHGTFHVHNSRGNHYLQICRRKDGFIIDGSFRKWYLGAKSMHDLTPVTILKCCAQIAECLNIQLVDLLDAKLLILEVGLTLHISINCWTFLQSVYRYSNFEQGTYETSKSFRGHDHWFNLYDKTVEISKQRTTEAYLDSKKLRIEIKAFKRTAFESQFKGIATIREAIQNHRKLLFSLVKAINKIEMQPIDMSLGQIDLWGKTTKDFNEFTRYYLVKTLGARQVFELIKQLGIHSSGKTYQRNKFREVLKQYDSNAVYRKRDFTHEAVKQIYKQLILPVPVL